MRRDDTKAGEFGLTTNDLAGLFSVLIAASIVF